MARFPVGGRGPVGLAVDAATIWVVRSRRRRGGAARPRDRPGRGQDRARSRAVRGRARGRRFRPSLVAVGAGAGWVATAPRRRGPRRLGQQPRGRGDQARPPGPRGIAVAGRIVWVAQGGHGLARIDAASQPAARDDPARRPGRPDRDRRRHGLGRRSVDGPRPEAAGAVARIDAGTGRVREVVPAACRPAWPPGSGASGSRSGTPPAGRWSASGRGEPRRSCAGCPPWGSWPSAAAPSGRPTAAGRGVPARSRPVPVQRGVGLTRRGPAMTRAASSVPAVDGGMGTVGGVWQTRQPCTPSSSPMT
jgi:hypothetical protein